MGAAHIAAGNLPTVPYIPPMHSDQPPDRPPDQPGAEPDIIPPESGTARWRGRGPGVVVLIDRLGYTRHITFAKPGPLAIILAVLLVGAVATAVLLLLLGFVLIWIPVSLAIIAALVLVGFVRRFWRRTGSR